jgi:hypothetical protein
MLKRSMLGLATIVVAGQLSGCGSSDPGRPSEEVQKDPAWIQAKLKEMDKELTPDKPIRQKR